jgi:predicted subunit of tRNA(5-methylaminomethyl-2-thiouridylate) methyltransferase
MTSEELEAKARAATHGEWRWDACTRTLDAVQEGEHVVTVAYAAPLQGWEASLDIDQVDIEFIIAAQPANVIAMAQRERELRNGLKAALDAWDKFRNAVGFAYEPAMLSVELRRKLLP